MLKDYKINPNEFRITTNLIYLVLNPVLFALFHSLPASKPSLVSMQYNPMLRALKTKETLCKINCGDIMKKDAHACVFKFLCINLKRSFSIQVVEKWCNID